MNGNSLALTVQETAQIMGLSVGLMYQMIREGNIPHLRFGGRILVLKKALLDMLEGKNFKHEQNQDENDQYIVDYFKKGEREIKILKKRPEIVRFWAEKGESRLF